MDDSFWAIGEGALVVRNHLRRAYVHSAAVDFTCTSVFSAITGVRRIAHHRGVFFQVSQLHAGVPGLPGPLGYTRFWADAGRGASPESRAAQVIWTGRFGCHQTTIALAPGNPTNSRADGSPR